MIYYEGTNIPCYERVAHGARRIRTSNAFIACMKRQSTMPHLRQYRGRWLCMVQGYVGRGATVEQAHAALCFGMKISTALVDWKNVLIEYGGSRGGGKTAAQEAVQIKYGAHVVRFPTLKELADDMKRITLKED